MRTLIRHYRNQITGNGVTVAILINEKTAQVVSRGIAICSKKDQFSKKRGRDLAIGRANKAYKIKRDCPKNKICRSNIKKLLLFPNKCMFHPILTPTEYTWVQNSLKRKKSNGK